MSVSLVPYGLRWHPDRLCLFAPAEQYCFAVRIEVGGLESLALQRSAMCIDEGSIEVSLYNGTLPKYLHTRYIVIFL